MGPGRLVGMKPNKPRRKNGAASIHMGIIGPALRPRCHSGVHLTGNDVSYIVINPLLGWGSGGPEPTEMKAMRPPSHAMAHPELVVGSR